MSTSCLLYFKRFNKSANCQIPPVLLLNSASRSRGDIHLDCLLYRYPKMLTESLVNQLPLLPFHVRLHMIQTNHKSMEFFSASLSVGRMPSKTSPKYSATSPGNGKKQWDVKKFDIGTDRNRRLQYVMFLCQLTFILLAFGKLHSEKDMWIDSVQMDFRTRLIFSSKAFRGLLPLDRISNRAPLATK